MPWISQKLWIQVSVMSYIALEAPITLCLSYLLYTFLARDAGAKSPIYRWQTGAQRWGLFIYCKVMIKCFEPVIQFSGGPVQCSADNTRCIVWAFSHTNKKDSSVFRPSGSLFVRRSLEKKTGECQGMRGRERTDVVIVPKQESTALLFVAGIKWDRFVFVVGFLTPRPSQILWWGPTW